MSYKKSQEVVYQGNKIRISKCQMDFGNGNTPTYELIDFDTATGISILPITETGLKLIKHYQLGLDADAWSLPTGGLEKGEDPKVRAGLELQEETGFKAARLDLLYRIHQLPGYIGGDAGYIYVAYDLTPSPLPGDEPFPIEVYDFTWKEALEMIRNGEIVDGRTLTTIVVLHPIYSTFVK